MHADNKDGADFTLHIMTTSSNIIDIRDSRA